MDSCSIRFLSLAEMPSPLYHILTINLVHLKLAWKGNANIPHAYRATVETSGLNSALMLKVP